MKVSRKGCNTVFLSGFSKNIHDLHDRIGCVVFRGCCHIALVGVEQQEMRKLMRQHKGQKAKNKRYYTKLAGIVPATRGEIWLIYGC